MSSAKDRGDLTITLRMKGRPVVLVGEGDIADEHRTLLKRAGAFIVAEGSKAAFAIVVDDPAAVSRLKVRGCLVYAVGQPDLSDFTLASPALPAKAAAPTKAARRAKNAIAKLRTPEPVSQHSDPTTEAPHAPASVPVTPEVRKPERAARLPKVPRPRRPPVEIKLPQVSFQPAIHAAKAMGQLAHRLWVRSRVLLSPLFRMSTPFTRTVASNIQDRIDRARERPISLDLALVKGGLLDHEPESARPEQPAPAAGVSADTACSSVNPDGSAKS